MTFEYPQNESRYIERRIQTITGNDGIRERIAEAVSWSELGYSTSGIAKQMESTEQTIKKYFDEIASIYSSNVLYPRTQDFDVEVTLEDRSIVLLSISCPDCRESRLVSQDGISILPNALLGTSDNVGRIWPVSDDGSTMIVHGNEIELDEEVQPINFREVFLASNDELVCLDCLWSGKRSDLN